VYLVFILDALNLHLSGGVEDIHVKDGYIGRIPTISIYDKIKNLSDFKKMLIVCFED
jgi:hypothetical protein